MLQVSSNPQINVTMAVGAVSEKVTVTANSAMVETHSTGIGQVVDNQRVVELPLNGRQATELIFLVGPRHVGARGRPQHQQELSDRHDLGGRRPGQRHDLHHGRRHPQRSVQQPQPADAVSRMRCRSSRWRPAPCRRATATMRRRRSTSSPSRAPTRFKGSAFEFIRNYHFNASNAFATTRDSLQRNQFGGVLGGPMMQEQGCSSSAATRAGSRRPTRRPASATSRRRAMLTGDFTAFASPACNGGGQRQPDRRLRRTTRSIPSRLSPVAQNFAKYLPVDQADPCGRVQYRHPQQQHRAPGADQGRLHAEQPAVDLRPLSLRGLRQPRDLRRQERADAQPHRPEQPGALGRGRPQLRAVVVRELAARHLQQDAQRSPAAGVLHRHRPGQQGVQPAAGIHGHQRHRQRLRGRQRRHQSRLLRFGWLPARRRRRLVLQGNHQISFGGNWIHTKIETLNNRPTNGAVHVQRPGHGPVARRLHDRARSAAVSCRATPSTTTTITTTSAPTSRTTGASAPNVTAQRRRALGAVHPAAQHLQLGEPLRPGALRCRSQEHGLSAGAGRIALPRR